MPIRYLIVDDHPTFRRGVVATLEDEGDFHACGEAATAAEAIQLYRKLQPDVVLMDLRLPDSGGVECSMAILQIDPSARILILTTFESDEDVFRAVQAGVVDYLIKDSSPRQIAEAMKRAMDGSSELAPHLQARISRRESIPELTPRERDTLNGLAQGLTNKEIADKLGVGDESIKTYLKTLYQKLRVMDRTQAVIQAMKIGLVRG
jgi:two-component system, NarL family, response regulator